MWVCMRVGVCVNVDDRCWQRSHARFQGGDQGPPRTRTQSGHMWRGSGWACLWDVPSWASVAVEEAAAAELVCCRPTIGQKCYSWEGLCKLGRSSSHCSNRGLESYRRCEAGAQLYPWVRDSDELQQRHAHLWFPRPKVEVISHWLAIYFRAENKDSTKTSHSQQMRIKNTES